MKTLTLDAATLAKLPTLDDLIEVRDESGQVLGYFHPRPPGKVIPAKEPWGEGLRRSAGALAQQWTDEDDRILDELHQGRRLLMKTNG